MIQVEEDVEDDETNDLYLDDVLNKTAAPTADGDMEVCIFWGGFICVFVS